MRRLGVVPVAGVAFGFFSLALIGLASVRVKTLLRQELRSGRVTFKPQAV